VTVRPIVADLFPLCGLGFARTDFSLPPPPSPPLLRAIAKQGHLPAWMRRADRFSSAAIIFVQASDGRHPSLLIFVASRDIAVCCDGQNRFARKQEAAHSPQVFEASWVGCESQRGSSCAEDCTRAVYLLNNQLKYFRKTKRSVWNRNHGASDQALMEESAL
jgi:hypothetical protein